MNLSEHDEHCLVVQALRSAGLLFSSVPNGFLRTASARRRAHSEGALSGMPDLLIFTPAPLLDSSCGVALEMKTFGGVPSDVSPEQRAVLQALADTGLFVPLVGFGACDALWQLYMLGYRVPRPAGVARDRLEVFRALIDREGPGAHPRDFWMGELSLGGYKSRIRKRG